jgi:8-oxo-dGTP diphosphatase
MRRILAGVILLILYGSFFPWRFSRVPSGPVLVWPRTLLTGDALLNFLIYLPVGACAYYAFSERRRLRFILPVALAFMLSLLVELTQVFIPGRASELSDLLMNTLGGACGMAAVALVPLRPTPEVLLLVSWAAHLLSRGFQGWVVECFGCLIAASAAFPQKMRSWRWAVAAACYLAILYRGLSPFVFVTRANPFDWVPFQAFLLADWSKVLPILFSKLFWYAAAVWVLHRLGRSWPLSGGVAAAFLLAIEIAQRHIPPHVPEITDPAMALLLAGVFAALPAAVMVVAGIIRRDSRILICQRKRGSRHELKWEFPGGKVERREMPRDALARELREELGIDVAAGKEMARYEYAYPSRAPIQLIFYEVTGFSGEPRNQVFEQIRWEEPSRLASYEFLEGDERFLRLLTNETTPSGHGSERSRDQRER